MSEESNAEERSIEQQASSVSTSTHTKAAVSSKAENVELKLIEQRLSCQTDVKLKLLVVGSSLVGKTSLVSRFDNSESQIDNIKQTLPGDFHHFIIPIGDNRKAHVRLWDMGGMEKLHSGDQLASFYSGINAVMLVFSLDSHESFCQLPNWLDRIGRMSDCSRCQKQKPLESIDQINEQKKSKLLAPCQHIDCTLVGNKSDLVDKRLISYLEADQFARHYGMTYVETSAQTMDNVNKAFFDLVLAASRRCLAEQNLTSEQEVAGLSSRGGRRSKGWQSRRQRFAGLKALCCSCTAGRDRA